MKKYLLAFLISGLGLNAGAVDHTQHAKHNMLLFGEAENYYASHIVYKVPHNYQVILKIDFSLSTKEKIRGEMVDHSADEFIFLLDHMDISQIKLKPALSGKIFRTDSEGKKSTIFEQVELEASQYSIIYFDEVPLNLQN
jgi:hypothetical protein